MSQDEHRTWSDRVQQLTDQKIKQINDMLAVKETEIRTV